MPGVARVWSSTHDSRCLAAPPRRLFLPDKHAQEALYKAAATVCLNEQGVGANLTGGHEPSDTGALGSLGQANRFARNLTVPILLERFASKLKTEYPNLSASVEASAALPPPERRAALEALNTFICKRFNREWKMWAQAQAVNNDQDHVVPTSLVLRMQKGMTQFPLVQLPTLRILDLSDNMDLTVPPNLGGCTNLQQVYLSNTGLAAPPILEGCTGLTLLEMNDSKRLSRMPGLAGFTNLTTLHIKGCSELTTGPDLTNCTALLTLLMNNCTNLTMPPNLRNCTALDTLHMKACTSLTESPGFADCAALRVLNIQGCSMLTTPPVLANCTQLKFLVMTGCTALTARPLLATGVVLRQECLPSHAHQLWCR